MWKARSSESALECAYRSFCVNRSAGCIQIACSNEKMLKFAKKHVFCEAGVTAVDVSWCRVCPEWKQGDADLLEQVESERDRYDEVNEDG